MKKFFLILGSTILALVLLILAQTVDPEQVDPKTTTFVFPKKLQPDHLSIDSLWGVVGDKKTVPEGFEKAALVAYSAYPQLKEVNIEMILTQSGAPMESNFNINITVMKIISGRNNLSPSHRIPCYRL